MTMIDEFIYWLDLQVKLVWLHTRMWITERLMLLRLAIAPEDAHRLRTEVINMDWVDFKNAYPKAAKKLEQLTENK